MSANLIDNGSATGPTAGLVVAPGRYCFAVDGTFGGATVTLSLLSPDGSSYISCGTDAALTAEGAVEVELPATTVKAVVSGGSPSALYASLERIGV